MRLLFYICIHIMPVTVPVNAQHPVTFFTKNEAANVKQDLHNIHSQRILYRN